MRWLAQGWWAGDCGAAPRPRASAALAAPPPANNTLLPRVFFLNFPTPQKEVEWVDAYHRQVWEALSPRLQGAPEQLEWLRQATSPL